MDLIEAYDDTKTSVDLAARLGNVVLMKELLQQGYPTNGHNNRGWRPLHEAAAGGHVECVRLLLEAEDAEVDAATHMGLTALYLACEPDKCHLEVVKLLLHAGADPNVKYSNYRDLPLLKAVLNNLYDIVKLLLDAGGNPDRSDYLNGAPLLTAVKKGHLKIAQLLVERGAKVDFQDHWGDTAIHFLLLPSCQLMEDSTLIPFIDLLVNGGLDVNAQMLDGTTPLMLAIQRNKVGVISRLLELGADPSIENNLGFLALHYAIESCPDSSMERLDGLNSKGETTNHVFWRILVLTLKDLLIPAKFQMIGKSIYHFAIERDKLNILKLMVNAGLSPDVCLESTCGMIELRSRLCKLRLGIDLGMRVNTPLGFLLTKPLNKKRVEMAKFMIDKGSNVNVVRPSCLPPLVAAVMHQRACYNHGCPGLDILEHLLNNGVDVMHKIRATDILPTALHISSLVNVQAFFALLVRCIPVHEIYTPCTLKSLSQLYTDSWYYELQPWRVISWLNVVNAFVPQLPLDMKNMFYFQHMVKDDNLSRAWEDLEAQIGSPKKLEQLCVLTVRRVVGERRDWKRLTTFLRKLTLMNEPLPDLIVDLLTFKQMESSRLSKWPPHEALSSYVLSAADRRNSNSIDVDADDEGNYDNCDDGNCDKEEEDDEKGAEEQNNASGENSQIRERK